jgi:molybdopterin-guanine dinucleotide biosynthesis protein A
VRDLGDQFVGERVLLTGISYDHKDDVLVIALDTPAGLPEVVEHLVQHPRREVPALPAG